MNIGIVVGMTIGSIEDCLATWSQRRVNHPPRQTHIYTYIQTDRHTHTQPLCCSCGCQHYSNSMALHHSIHCVMTTSLSMQYPQTRPVVSFGKWRGLSERHLQVIRQELKDRMESLLGTQMLFDLITVRE